jgi:hypothetical protein
LTAGDATKRAPIKTADCGFFPGQLTGKPVAPTPLAGTTIPVGGSAVTLIPVGTTSAGPQHHLRPSGSLTDMQPMPDEHTGHGDHLTATWPAVEVHGRVVTATRPAAAWYKQARRAIDSRRATTALRLAVGADPSFGLAAADLGAITRTSGSDPGLSMTTSADAVGV